MRKKKNNKKEITFIEHEAGEYEDGLQVCIYCGEVLADFSEMMKGEWELNVDGESDMSAEEVIESLFVRLAT